MNSLGFFYFGLWATFLLRGMDPFLAKAKSGTWLGPFTKLGLFAGKLLILLQINFGTTMT